MTDSTTPDGSNPSTDERDERRQPDETEPREGRTDDPSSDGAELPNSTTEAAPLSNSTDGGLEGGDPGVEE